MAKTKHAETHDVPPSEPQGPPVPEGLATNRLVVGSMVHYFVAGDAQPQAAVVTRICEDTDGERVDLFVFGVASQGLSQGTAQKVPLYRSRESLPERCREWCEFA